MGRRKAVIEKTPERVEIDSGGHSIVVESPGGLEAVAGRAVQLWRDVRAIGGPTAADDGSFSTGFTYVSEPVHTPLLPPEAELPVRLQPDDAETE